MASQIVNELRTTTDVVWARLRSDAPGEWTTRQVLCHVLSEPGWRPVDQLAKIRKAGQGRPE